MLLKILQILKETSVLESLFNNVASSNFIKKRLQHRCFPANFWNFKISKNFKNTSGVCFRDRLRTPPVSASATGWWSLMSLYCPHSEAPVESYSGKKVSLGIPNSKFHKIYKPNPWNIPKHPEGATLLKLGSVASVLKRFCLFLGNLLQWLLCQSWVLLHNTYVCFFSSNESRLNKTFWFWPKIILASYNTSFYTQLGSGLSPQSWSYFQGFGTQNCLMVA